MTLPSTKSDRQMAVIIPYPEWMFFGGDIKVDYKMTKNGGDMKVEWKKFKVEEI